MKEKTISFLKSNLFFSVVLNTFIMLFCINITSFSYDSIKDFYNSLYICQYHHYYSHEINYILSVFVGSIQFVLTNFNSFVLTQILLSCISFISITYVFSDKFGKIKALFFSLLLNILFAFNHYAAINSSKTAAILLVGGLLLTLSAIRNKKYNLPFLIGIIEIILGSFFDFKYFFIACGFYVVFFVADMISKKKYKLAFRKFFWYFRPFLLVLLLLVSTVVGLNRYSYSVNNASAEASDYYKYSYLTEEIGHLPYPDFDDHKIEFESVGILSESDYELLKNGYYDKDTSLNLNALNLVTEIQEKENSKTILTESGNIFVDLWSHFASFDCYAIVCILILITFITFIFLHKRRFAFFPVFILISALISSVLMRYFHSGATYLVYGIWLMTFTFILYSFDFENFKNFERINLPSILKVKKDRIFIASLCLIAVCAGYFTVYQLNLNSVDENKKPKAIFAEINRHPDRYYVFDPTSIDDYIKYTDNYIHPLWGFRDNFLINVDGFSYFNKSNERLKRNYSENIYEAVLNGEKIYVIDKYMTYKKEEYFTQYYSDRNTPVIYNQINELDNYKVYKIEYLNLD